MAEFCVEKTFQYRCCINVEVLVVLGLLAYTCDIRLQITPQKTVIWVLCEKSIFAWRNEEVNVYWEYVKRCCSRVIHHIPMNCRNIFFWRNFTSMCHVFHINNGIPPIIPFAVDEFGKLFLPKIGRKFTNFNTRTLIILIMFNNKNEWLYRLLYFISYVDLLCHTHESQNGAHFKYCAIIVTYFIYIRIFVFFCISFQFS